MGGRPPVALLPPAGRARFALNPQFRLPATFVEVLDASVVAPGCEHGVALPAKVTHAHGEFRLRGDETGRQETVEARALDIRTAGEGHGVVELEL